MLLITFIWPIIIFFMNLLLIMHRRKTVASIFMDKFYYFLLLFIISACLLPRSNCLTTIAPWYFFFFCSFQWLPPIHFRVDVVILLFDSHRKSSNSKYLNNYPTLWNRKYILNFKVNAPCLILFCTSISFYYCRNMISPEWCMVICFVALIIIFVLFRMYSK